MLKHKQIKAIVRHGGGINLRTWLAEQHAAGLKTLICDGYSIAY